MNVLPLTPEELAPKPPFCCHMDCDEDAEFVIIGSSGDPDDFTHACARHVGELLGTPEGARENRAWFVCALGKERTS